MNEMKARSFSLETSRAFQSAAGSVTTVLFCCPGSPLWGQSVDQQHEQFTRRAMQPSIIHIMSDNSGIVHLKDKQSHTAIL